KKVVTIHNNPYEDYCYEYGSVIGKGMANLLRYRLPKFYKIVSISAFVKESLSYDLSNHLVIHNGVSLHKIDAISNSGTDVNISNRSSPFNIGIVSALIPRKNIFEAVDIVVELNTNGFSCSLDIVGEGEQREELYNYITSHGANDYITLKGSLSYNETLKFISELDLFIFTSFSEGFGLVLVEAMMLKVPILAKTSKISLEVLGDERLCFSSFNDFREKLETITSNVTDI
ncbi:glycosyltransferase, partial [Vibrio fluvialis]|nr:glycosyltransferase [Vibrio fluvialis]